MAKRKKGAFERTKEERDDSGIKVTDYLRGCQAGYYSRGRDYIKMTNLEWLHELARGMADAGIRVRIHESEKNKGHFALYRYTGEPIKVPEILHPCGIPKRPWKVCHESRCCNRESCEIYEGKTRAGIIDRKLHKAKTGGLNVNKEIR